PPAMIDEGGKNEEKGGIFMTDPSSSRNSSPLPLCARFRSGNLKTTFAAQRAQNLTFPQKNAWSQSQQPRPLVALVRESQRATRQGRPSFSRSAIVRPAGDKHRPACCRQDLEWSPARYSSSFVIPRNRACMLQNIGAVMAASMFAALGHRDPLCVWFF